MENKEIDLKPALFTFIISSWAIGRSGILSSFVLLIGLIFLKFRAKPKYIVIICYFFASLCYFFASLFYDLPMFGNIASSFFESESVNTVSYFKASMEKVESERWIIWTNYFNNLDIFRVIFGVNVFEDPWLGGEALAYNYHNSFILLHSQTGFMGLITLALIIFSLFKFYRINKVFFILLLTLILRSFTDVVIFFNRFDFVPFFFIFYFLELTSKRLVSITHFRGVHY